MHHLARRTSLVGRQPEAQLREEGVGERRGGETGREQERKERGKGCQTTDGNFLGVGGY